MDLKITPEALAEFRDKDSKVKRFLELYEKEDFLAAYAKHTDLRMADNPKGAIGREDEWETHGLLQLEFLRQHGLEQHHRLLDVGCGPGRAARCFVPFLAAGHYTGIDISSSALEYAVALAEHEGWDANAPTFLLNGDADFGAHEFDFVWAHSVFTHLPPDQISDMVRNIGASLSPGGKFLFTYKRAEKPTRSGLKQFQYPDMFFIQLAAQHSLRAEPLRAVFPAGQRTFLLAK